MRAVAAAAAVSLALVAAYLALGGASYAPAKVADPCASRDWRDPGLSEVAEQIVLSALDGAACELGVTREDVVLAFENRDELERFAQEHQEGDQELEELLRWASSAPSTTPSRPTRSLRQSRIGLRGLVRRIPSRPSSSFLPSALGNILPS